MAGFNLETVLVPLRISVERLNGWLSPT